MKRNISKTRFASIIFLLFSLVFSFGCTGDPDLINSLLSLPEGGGEGGQVCFMDYLLTRPASFIPVGIGAGTAPRGIAKGDFNGDGSPDLVVTSFNPTSNLSAITVLLNNGRGQFTGSNLVPGATTTMSVATGDVNGDGDVDFVTSNFDNNSVNIYWGSGDGSFGPFTVLGPLPSAKNPQRPTFVQLADVDGANGLDIILCYSTDLVTVLLNNGTGGFPVSVDTALPAAVFWPRSLAVGDFDGDGNQDVVVAPNQPGLVTMLGNGDGSFQVPSIIPFDANDWLSFVIATDLNGDGNLDLSASITQDIGAGIWDDRVAILNGNGDGTFQAAVDTTVGRGPKGEAALGAAQLDGLGNFDIVVTNSQDNTVSVLYDALGTVRVRKSYAVGTNPHSAVIGDFDGSGYADLAVTNTGSRDVAILFADFLCLAKD